MLPLQLRIENFGSFREPTTVDFTDADYFALVGPTGAGKTTVIDAICFSLYGTVPRWGKENVVALALAPSASLGRVALVFEAGGRRYGVVRVLARSGKKGTVGTKEARLDELDRAVPVDADLTEMLEAVVRPLAEGDQVTGAVAALTGLEYRYFTQCVVLPQGQFAEFLHAKPSDRQDLLVRLLDAGVYERIRARAVREEERADQAATFARGELDRFADADEAAETAAEDRLHALKALAADTEESAEELAALEEALQTANEEYDSAEQRRDALAALAMPAGVATLSESIRQAEEATRTLARDIAKAEEAELQAEADQVEAGDKTKLAAALQAHEDKDRLEAEPAEHEKNLAATATQIETLADQLQQAKDALQQAERHRQAVRDQDIAADLAARLQLGEPCPVCLRPLTELPDHAVPADLASADDAAQQAETNLDEADDAHRKAELAHAQHAAAHRRADRDLVALTPTLQAHPDRKALRASLDAVAEAETKANAVRAETRKLHRLHKAAEENAAGLRQQAEEEWGRLETARDAVAALRPSTLPRDDLQHAWQALLEWRDTTALTVDTNLRELQRHVLDARQARDGQRVALLEPLCQQGLKIPPDPTPTAIRIMVAEEVTRAKEYLHRVRDNRAHAAKLTKQIGEYEQARRVAHTLAGLLRANNFEQWLCSEALALLMAAASETLRELSAGQYELALNERTNAIEVIDYGEAGLRRSARTLSGGETFQAALALALALSERVAGLAAAAARSLDSIFLDEGFGTLDLATLETVAATLERLAGGERMVGIVTHVPALAERVPVRFEIRRDERGSHLTKVTA
jgi:DNA repair exonuclease SbcCD ATPase subunit